MEPIEWLLLGVCLVVLLITAPLFIPLGCSEPGAGYKKARAKELKREARKLHKMPYQ